MFRETGSFDNHNEGRSGRSRSTRTNNNTGRVLQKFLTSPKESECCKSRELGMAHSSVQLMVVDIGAHFYLMQEASPSIKVDPDMMMEDSLDGGPPSVGSGDMPTPMSNMITPISSRKKQLSKKVVTGYILYSGDVRRTVAAKHPESSFGDISRIVGNEKQIGKKLLTGYILYCSEVRRSVTANHSESTFGEISRIIGNQWRNLPAQEKQSWEEKAAKVNEESALKMADPDQYPSPSIAIAIPVGPPVENQVCFLSLIL
ncbi:unnamed protein product [Timema podura]|uniref:HMG box domain-containing protein n=1 Tax=Timema podura TaxID=61482 RepID=A0ABN7PE68_TIMPD|nr:unnamed protein product [Timema podura]